MAKSKRAKSVPADETKADKFKRVGSLRVSKALKAIRLIGNVSNRSGYDYTKEQVTAIGVALANEIDAVLSRFNPEAKTAANSEFQL